jgi:protocatechuate 3,4-dioxygenase beta subunit
MINTTKPRTGDILPRTPDQVLGPFYPVNNQPDLSGNLAYTAGVGEARGQLIYVVGQVRTCAGQPVPQARIEIWQANADGKYRHPGDTKTAPLDPNFQGYALLATDADGRYRLRTVKPNRYQTPDGKVRPPHIHFMVQGRFDRLVTQLYFAGEPENLTDRWLRAAPRPELLIAALEPATPDLESNARIATFNIVLPNG